MGAGFSYTVPSSPSDSFISLNISNLSSFKIQQVKINYTIEYFTYESFDPYDGERFDPTYRTDSSIEKDFSSVGSSLLITLFNDELFNRQINNITNIYINYEFTLDNAYKFTIFDSVPINNTNSVISGQFAAPLSLLYSNTEPSYGTAITPSVNIYIARPPININFTVDISLKTALDTILSTTSPDGTSVPTQSTQSQELTETVTKSAFELVESGLTLCQIDGIRKYRLNEILKNIQALRNYSRDTGSTTTYNNNGSLNQAGSRYTENFPSAKFANSVGINELLLSKKKYMFSNSLNKNVVSGPIASNTLSGYSNTLPYNAGSSGLTKVQQFANAARGRTLSGGPGRRYGVQFYDGRSLVSIPNIYNQTNQTTQTINICDFT
jgi:hypothetical protein